jgi:anti-sigma factor RsiW
MSCHKFEPMIALYIEDDLAQAEAQAVESHLAACDACRKFALEMRESQAALKALRTEFVDDAVLLQVRMEVLSVAAHRPRIVAWPRYAIAAGLVIALLAGWLVRQQADKALVALQPLHAILPVPPARWAIQAHQPKALAARVRRRSKRQAPRFKSEPLVVKMITDDPQVVIYWLVDQNGG